MLRRTVLSLAALAAAAMTVEPETPVLEGASTSDAPFVSFIGDSWTYGTGATDLNGYAYRAGKAAGWQRRVLGVGGSGYSRDGAGLRFRYRIAEAVEGNPDVVVIQGSMNDRATPTTDLRIAVRATLGSLKTQAGADTTVLVMGVSYVPGELVSRYTTDRINSAVRTEAQALGLRFLDVAAGNWSDPADPTIWADEYHVNDVGAQRVAARLSTVLAAYA